MTECTSKALQFSSVSRKKILADFRRGHLTSDGGALLLREVNRRTGLIDALAAWITDPREPAKIKNGKVDGDTISLQRTFERNGNEFTITFKGKVTGDRWDSREQRVDGHAFRSTWKSDSQPIVTSAASAFLREAWMSRLDAQP